MIMPPNNLNFGRRFSQINAEIMRNAGAKTGCPIITKINSHFLSGDNVNFPLVIPTFLILVIKLKNKMNMYATSIIIVRILLISLQFGTILFEKSQNQFL